jgi:hypothetical protein
MLVFAVTTLEKVRGVSPRNLANVGLAILVIIVAVILIKMAARMNKIIFVMIMAVTAFVVGMTWVYHRNEPKFLTPLIDRIAPFVPNTPTPYSQRSAPGAEGPAAPKKPAPPVPPPPKSY